MRPLRAAFTLLEIMIATMILALVIAAAGTSLDMGQRLNERITLENELNDKVNRVLNDVAMELRTCDANPSNIFIGSPTSPWKAPIASDYGADGYADYTKLQIYQYCVSSGIQLYSGKFTGLIESQVGQAGTCHRLVYDPKGGTLTKELWSRDATGATTTRQWRVMLCDQLLSADAAHPRGGFYIDQIGNTLAMELSVFTSYRTGYSGETIIKVADSQVLFLRSTLDTNLGSAAYNASDATFTGDNTATASPTLFYGHLITYGASTFGEISLFAQPPIGQRLNNGVPITTGSTNAYGVTVTVQYIDATGTLSAPVTMVEDTDVTVHAPPAPAASTVLKRVTRPDKNGNVTVTLSGNIVDAICVTATAATKAGLSTTLVKTF